MDPHRNKQSYSSVTLNDLARVNVVGTSGVGKSTFARQLAERLGSEYIEMDALYWLPNWGQPSEEEFFQALENKLGGETWVLDGNYSRTNAVKWRLVRTVIWLDYSFPRTLFQVVTRTLGRTLVRRELWPGTGNRESFWKSFFHRDSIIWWMISSFRRRRKKYAAMHQNRQDLDFLFIRLRSPARSRAFLSFVEKMANKGS